MINIFFFILTLLIPAQSFASNVVWSFSNYASNNRVDYTTRNICYRVEKNTTTGEATCTDLRLVSGGAQSLYLYFTSTNSCNTQTKTSATWDMKYVGATYVTTTDGIPQLCCPDGQQSDGSGNCVPICPTGATWSDTLQTCQCPVGSVYISDPPSCEQLPPCQPIGYVRNDNNDCVPPPNLCDDMDAACTEHCRDSGGVYEFGCAELDGQMSIDPPCKCVDDVNCGECEHFDNTLGICVPTVPNCGPDEKIVDCYCVPDDPITCPDGQHLSYGECVDDTPTNNPDPVPEPGNITDPVENGTTITSNTTTTTTTTTVTNPDGTTTTTSQTEQTEQQEESTTPLSAPSGSTDEPYEKPGHYVDYSVLLQSFSGLENAGPVNLLRNLGTYFSLLTATPRTPEFTLKIWGFEETVNLHIFDSIAAMVRWMLKIFMVIGVAMWILRQWRAG